MRAIDKIRIETKLNKTNNIMKACKWLLEHEELFDNELKELDDNDLCEIGHLLTIKEKYKKVLDKVKE